MNFCFAISNGISFMFDQEHPSIKALTGYLLEKAAVNPALLETLKNIIGPNTTQHVGFVFCERLINMPVQVIPPMYRMLTGELKGAIENVRHSLFIRLAAPY